MDLWRVYATLSVAVSAVAVWVVAAACRPTPTARDSRAVERTAFRRLLLPVMAGAAVIAFFSGWALREPDPADEHVGLGMYVLAAVAAMVVARAVLRALLALYLSRAPIGPVVTVGFVRCQVAVAEEFRQAAAPAVLRAALAHEAAHARGRDPLRIWLAQIAADLQWPVPGAVERFQRWLLALEMRRDDDAVATGASPAALAESIVLAARMVRARPSTPIGVGVAGDGTGLALRVRRLLGAESVPRVPSTDRVRYAPILILTVLGAALFLGSRFGDLVLTAIPGVR